MSSKPIILVQGASGHTGYATVKALTKYSNQYKIRAGVRDLTKAAKFSSFGSDVEVVLLDTQFPQSAIEAFNGVSKLMICPPNSEDRVEVVKLLVQSAVNHTSIHHIGLISMLDANKEAISFHQQFRSMELFLEQSGVPFTVFRCALFMDTLLNFASQILKGELYLPLNSAGTSMISTKDVGECVAAVLSSDDGAHKRRYYNLAGSEFLDGSGMAAALSQGLEIPVLYGAVPNKDAYIAFLNNGFESWQSRGFVEFFDYLTTERNSKVINDFETLVDHKPAQLSQWSLDNRHKFIGNELLQTDNRLERHVHYTLDSTQTLVPPELIHQATNEQGQHTINQQGQQGAAHPRGLPVGHECDLLQKDLRSVACYQKTPFPHLSGHSAHWYENYYPQHQERRARAAYGNVL